MSDGPPRSNIVRPITWDRLRADQAEKIVRERASSSSNVIFGVHAFDRIEYRSITEIDARTILIKGQVEGEPRLCANGQDWKVVVVRRMPGDREAGVVTIIYRPPNNTLFVVTVEWMDLDR